MRTKRTSNTYIGVTHRILVVLGRIVRIVEIRRRVPLAESTLADSAGDYRHHRHHHQWDHPVGHLSLEMPRGEVEWRSAGRISHEAEEYEVSVTPTILFGLSLSLFSFFLFLSRPLVFEASAAGRKI